MQAIRKIQGVVKADGLLGSPDAIAIVEGNNIASMDAVIDRIAELPNVLATESKVEVICMIPVYCNNECCS